MRSWKALYIATLKREAIKGFKQFINLFIAMTYSAFCKHSYHLTYSTICCVTAWTHTTCYEFYANLLKLKIQTCLIYISSHTPLLWRSKLSSGASNFLWSSSRHDWSPPVSGQLNCFDRIEKETHPSTYGPTVDSRCQKQKIYHEAQGTVCRSPR